MPTHPIVDDLASAYRRVREASEELTAGFSPEDATVQSMPDVSPTKWHLAHTTWFFETFVLERSVGETEPFDPAFRVLFNSYYNTVGELFPRAERGLITRPGLARIRDYRRHVDEAIDRLLERGVDDDTAAIVGIGIAHEQQHQELILTDIKHVLSRNPLRPAAFDARPVEPDRKAAPLVWMPRPGGIHEIGHGGEGFHFDNEAPRHRVLLEPFAIASRPVTNGEILEFVTDRGYQTPELWLSEGWDLVRREGWRAPLYWREDAEGWSTLELGGPRAVDREAPAAHLSYFEADAYARWAGARLPSEAEWEVCMAALPVEGNFLERGHHRPVPSGSAEGIVQAFGDVWEWTRSAYASYPGFQPLEGSLGEYNGKFMINQMVLRGGSCATPASHVRASYRNFFPPAARWQFSGARLARDA